MQFDAVIVGAGPAGCVAARDLSRAGARVAIVDGTHPREKACGGGVTARAMALVPDACLRDRAIGQPIGSAVFEAGNLRAGIQLPNDEVLRVFPRAVFDSALLDRALSDGASLVPSRAASIERTTDGWSVRTARGSFAGSWLLGADGPSGLIRRRVFRPFARRQLSIAAGAFVDGTAASEIVVAFLDRPSGYLWSFPRRDHLAVGACAQADATSSADLHALTDRWLDTYPPAAGRTRRRYAWPIPSLSGADLDEERPAGDRWMLLGDAAGLVDPITREGIYFALQSGVLAARALGSPDPACAYASSVRGEIHPELKRAAQLRDAFFRPRFTRLLIQALNRSGAIRQVMIDLMSGRQTYEGLRRRLLRTLEIGLMWKLFGYRVM